MTNGDSNLQGQINNLNTTVVDHENRIDALQGASPSVYDGTVLWRLDQNNASGGSVSGGDAGDWNLSGVSTADSRWNVLTRNTVMVSAGCTPMASGSISPNVSAGTSDALDWDDIAYLKITYSGQQVNIMAYSMGNDGRYNIDFRVIAIPNSSGSCIITP